MVFLYCHYLLNTLTKITLSCIGITAFLRNNSGPEAERLKKKFQKLFEEKDLDIIVQCNSEINNYLDITLNLNDGSYRPYWKSNEETNYFHATSDHPPSVIKEIPQSIEKSTLSFIMIEKVFSEVSHLLWTIPRKQWI